MPRLFTGLEVPSDIGLALSLKRCGLGGARWIEKDSYHLTLNFIGDVEGSTAFEVMRALEGVGGGGFEVRLDGLGVFGGGKPRALYASVAASEELDRLHGGQGRVLRQAGLTLERRKFVPHVTLARLRGTGANAVARALAETGGFTPLRFDVERFVLFSGRTRAGGEPYSIEQVYPL